MIKNKTHAGIGLRSPHFEQLMIQLPNFRMVEIHTENYFASGGQSLHKLKQVREHYPLSLHGTSLSIGTTDELNWDYLKKLRTLIDKVDPILVSDHLSWSSFDKRYYHDLLPLPYTDECVAHLTKQMTQVQDYLQRQILIENISSYIQFEQSTLTEWDFLREVAINSGCGILLDINNLYINALNFKFDPNVYFSAIPGHLIKEFHLAGFDSAITNHHNLIIDSHSKPIVPEVWSLFDKAIQMIGVKPTIIEWDVDLPSFETLCQEAFYAEQIIRGCDVAA